MAFIDRNPEEMLKYSKIVNSYVSNMSNMVTSIQGGLSYFESDLDDNCRQAIRKLDSDVKSFKSQVEYFNAMAKSIEAKAKAQINAKNGMKGF